jgi:hypothetical protein
MMESVGDSLAGLALHLGHGEEHSEPTGAHFENLVLYSPKVRDVECEFHKSVHLRLIRA